MSTQPIDAGAQPETAVVRRGYGSLYEIEDRLLALIETDDMVPEEEREEYLAELQNQLAVAADKRDHVGQFLAHLESQQELVRNERERLDRLGKRFAAVADRVEGAVRNTIISLGTDAKGKYRKLEGRTCVLSIQKNPDKLKLTDEASVPLGFKDAVITIDAQALEALLADLFEEDRAKVLAAIRRQDLQVRTNDVKAAIKSGSQVRADELAGELGRAATDEELEASLDAKPVVPGARLSTSYRVVRR